MLLNLSVPANPSTPVLPLAQPGLFLPRLSPRAFMSIFHAGAAHANAHTRPPAPPPLPKPLGTACLSSQCTQCIQQGQCMIHCAYCRCQCAHCMLPCTQCAFPVCPVHVPVHPACPPSAPSACSSAPSMCSCAHKTPYQHSAQQGPHLPVTPEGCTQALHGKLAGERREPPAKAARVSRWHHAAAVGRRLLTQEGCTARQQVGH